MQRRPSLVTVQDSNSLITATRSRRPQSDPDLDRFARECFRAREDPGRSGRAVQAIHGQLELARRQLRETALDIIERIADRDSVFF